VAGYRAMAGTDAERTLSDVAVVAGLLSSEVNHELAQTLNFLRYLLGQLGDESGGEVGTFARTEIERLTRLVQHLRVFKLPSPTLADVVLAEFTASCIARVQDAAELRRTVLIAEVPDSLRIRTDVEYLGAAVVQMLEHAIANSPPGSSVTIRALLIESSAQASMRMDVIDCGPALSQAKPAALFEIWGMVPIGGPAQRRAVAQRLLRHLGGALSYERREDRNIFSIAMPTLIEEQR